MRRLRVDRSRKSALNDCIAVEELDGNCCQWVKGPGGRMGVRPLHMHDALVIRAFQFRKVGMNQRGLAAVRVDVKERRVNRRRK